jgi:RNA polymerase sigma factor (sigma-70 family)
VRRFDAPLARFLRRVVGNATADDVRNATMLRAYQHAWQFRGGSAKAWLFRIGWREALRARSRARDLAEAPLDGALEYTDPAPRPAENAMRSEEQAHVRASFERLAPPDRALLWLCVVEAMPLEQASRVLGQPASTLRYRFARALERVRTDLQQNEFTPSHPAKLP